MIKEGLEAYEEVVISHAYVILGAANMLMLELMQEIQDHYRPKDATYRTNLNHKMDRIRDVLDSLEKFLREYNV